MSEPIICPRCSEKYESARQWCWVCNYRFLATPPIPEKKETPPQAAEIIEVNKVKQDFSINLTPRPSKGGFDSFLIGILTVIGVVALLPVLLFVTCTGLLLFASISN